MDRVSGKSYRAVRVLRVILLQVLGATLTRSLKDEFIFFLSNYPCEFLG